MAVSLDTCRDCHWHMFVFGGIVLCNCGGTVTARGTFDPGWGEILVSGCTRDAGRPGERF